MSIFGVCLTGVGVAFMKYAAFGIDPFQVLVAGLRSVVPLPFGLLFAAVCTILTVFALTQNRHLLGLATLITLFLQGYVIDASLNLLKTVFPAQTLLLRAVMFLVGITILCFSTSIYFTADLGVSPYDSIALIITDTWKKGRFSTNRMIGDLVCTAAGAVLCFLSGGVSFLLQNVGIGTIITAFFMGPVVSLFNEHLVRPWYRRLSGN